MKYLYKYIRGSHAHGISTPQSDIDYGGVFVCDNDDLLGLGLNYCDEISDERHDTVCWELGKFGRLLLKSNPSVLESLFVDDRFKEFTDPCMDVFFENRDKFLTKKCFAPFGHYAAAEIKKARGLNKMITKPILERKVPTDFCYVVNGNDTISVSDWLSKNDLTESDISLAKLNHAKDAYVIYEYPGGFCKSNGNDIYTNNIPKGLDQIGVLFFNKDAYSTHCREYKQQKEWESKRNPVRYAANIDKSYDAKNMSECARLIHTCTEIASGDTYHVNREGIDSKLLLDIRAHKYEYDELMEMMQKDIGIMENAINNSTIPDKIDPNMVDDLIKQVRKTTL